MCPGVTDLLEIGWAILNFSSMYTPPQLNQQYHLYTEWFEQEATNIVVLKFMRNYFSTPFKNQ